MSLSSAAKAMACLLLLSCGSEPVGETPIESWVLQVYPLLDQLEEPLMDLVNMSGKEKRGCRNLRRLRSALASIPRPPRIPKDNALDLTWTMLRTEPKSVLVRCKLDDYRAASQAAAGTRRGLLYLREHIARTYDLRGYGLNWTTDTLEEVEARRVARLTK